MRVLGSQLVLLAHQRVDHHIGGQAAFLGELAQPSDRHVQAVGQCLGQTRAVFDNGVELLAAQHTRCQRLSELQQGRLRFCC